MGGVALFAASFLGLLVSLRASAVQRARDLRLLAAGRTR
jgi:hypothetical protein